MKTMLAAGLAILAISAPAGASAVPESGRLAFDVYRNGKPLGVHVLTFKEEAGALRVTVDVDLAVRIGPLVAWRYRHDVRETWREGRLVALESETRKDGRDYALKVRAAADGLEVDGQAYDGPAPLDLPPSTYWNRKLVEASAMLNTETGEVLPIAVEKLGSETIDAGGETITATRYRLKSKLNLDLWYDEQGRWVKLAFDARGSQIDYVLAAGR